MFKFTRITYIYWPIAYTSKALFGGVLELARIAYIYWPIECTSKVYSYGVFKLTKNYLHLLAN